MRKYGIENFHIELVEETLNPEEREIYWIEQYGSFKNGYNATLGGDGRHYRDYDLIYSLYQEGKTIQEIAEILNYDKKTCRNALNDNGINKKMRKQRQIDICSKPIIQLDKDTKEIINIYPSITAACTALGKQCSGHIASVCQGKRKTAYGFCWKYGELE